MKITRPKSFAFAEVQPTIHREDEVVFTNLRERKLKREKIELEEEPEQTF